MKQFIIDEKSLEQLKGYLASCSYPGKNQDTLSVFSFLENLKEVKKDKGEKVNAKKSS